jgi:hypothetical protein
VLRLPLSSRDVLAWLVDLSAVPPMRMVAMLAAECPCPPETAQLRCMATDAAYKVKVSTPNTINKRTCGWVWGCKL